MRYDNEQLIRKITTIVDNWQQRIDESFFAFAARLLERGKQRCAKEGHSDTAVFGEHYRRCVCVRCGKVLKTVKPRSATKSTQQQERD